MSLLRNRPKKAPEIEQKPKDNETRYNTDAHIAPLERVKVANHPREHFKGDEMEALRDSIMAHGILVPLIVRYAGPYSREDYLVTKGSRRLIIARELGLPTVPVVVNNCDEATALAQTLTMEATTAQLSDLERGRAIARMIELMEKQLDTHMRAALPDADWKELGPRALHNQITRADFHDAPAWIAEAVEHAARVGRRPAVKFPIIQKQLGGMSRKTIYNLVNIAGMGEAMGDLLDDAEVPQNVLRVIASPQIPAPVQRSLARRAIREGWTGQRATQEVNRAMGRAATVERPALPVEQPVEADPIQQYLSPVRLQLVECRRAILQGQARFVPPSELKAALDALQEEIDLLRKVRFSQGEDK